jgi:hypothetical protein
MQPCNATITQPRNATIMQPCSATITQPCKNHNCNVVVDLLDLEKKNWLAAKLLKDFSVLLELGYSMLYLLPHILGHKDHSQFLLECNMIMLFNSTGMSIIATYNNMKANTNTGSILGDRRPIWEGRRARGRPGIWHFLYTISQNIFVRV